MKNPVSLERAQSRYVVMWATQRYNNNLHYMLNLIINSFFKKIFYAPTVQLSSSEPSQQSMNPSHIFLLGKHDIECPQRNCFVRSHSKKNIIIC